MTAVPQRDTCLCVVGWHFLDPFYEELARLREADVFVVSHQPQTPARERVIALCPGARVLWAPNVGYDWGAFAQFHRTGAWKAYRNTVFIHDDVRIVRDDLLAKVLERLERHPVIGNGRVMKGPMTPGLAEESYAHAQWRPPSAEFAHDAVRGSFFAVRREVLELPGCFQVFWDRFGITSSCGNWSTRASCAVWQQALGPDCFGFLADTPCASEWMVEFVRGVENGEKEVRKGLKGWLGQVLWNRGFVRLCKVYMRAYWRGGNALRDRATCAVVAPLVRLFGGEPGPARRTLTPVLPSVSRGT